MMTLSDIQAYLKSVRSRPDRPSPETVAEGIASLKAAAVRRRSHSEGTALWCYERALEAQSLFLRAFQQMKQGEFYKAWCDLEQAELSLIFLEPHDTVSWPECRLDFIREYVTKWQGLYPYRVFMSPEIVEHEKVCSICKKPASPRRHCGHRPGEIYDGEMCVRVVTKAECIGISFVDMPVQKYSVPFLVDPATGKSLDHYDYRVLRYAISALRNPFDPWEAVWTKRLQPHSRFRHLGRNALCPCDSGIKYKKCCLRESGVLRPHLEFTFGVTPPSDVAIETYFE